jgi:hypothetical protein
MNINQKAFAITNKTKMQQQQQQQRTHSNDE